MAKIFEALNTAFDFLFRRPNLDGSTLLKKESETLGKALEKYNGKAGEIELSLMPDFAETAAIVEGDGKSLITADFIKDFTSRNCSSKLVVPKADKKARTALLMLAARENKLGLLKQQLDPIQKYRELFHTLMKQHEAAIKDKIYKMKPADFANLVKAAGLDAIKTSKGTVSTSKASRDKVLKQILRDKQSDELMTGLAQDA